MGLVYAQVELSYPADGALGVLLGAIPMEDMDLIIHPLSRTPMSNPKNPNIREHVLPAYGGTD